MERDNYYFLANHLRDIHAQLEEKIKNHRTHSPKWVVGQVKGTDMVLVEELSSLLGIAILLEKLAGPLDQQQIMMPHED